MKDNRRYFVKSHFNGWCKVGYGNYNRFIQNIRENASGLKQEEKERYIQKVTRVECGGGETATEREGG